MHEMLQHINHNSFPVLFAQAWELIFPFSFNLISALCDQNILFDLGIPSTSYVSLERERERTKWSQMNETKNGIFFNEFSKAIENIKLYQMLKKGI